MSGGAAPAPAVGELELLARVKENAAEGVTALRGELERLGGAPAAAERVARRLELLQEQLSTDLAAAESLVRGRRHAADVVEHARRLGAAAAADEADASLEHHRSFQSLLSAAKGSLPAGSLPAGSLPAASSPGGRAGGGSGARAAYGFGSGAAWRGGGGGGGGGAASPLSPFFDAMQLEAQAQSHHAELDDDEELVQQAEEHGRAVRELAAELRWVDEGAIKARIESERRLTQLVESLAGRVATLEAEQRRAQRAQPLPLPSQAQQRQRQHQHQHQPGDSDNEPGRPPGFEKRSPAPGLEERSPAPGLEGRIAYLESIAERLESQGSIVQGLADSVQRSVLEIGQAMSESQLALHEQLQLQLPPAPTPRQVTSEQLRAVEAIVVSATSELKHEMLATVRQGMASVDSGLQADNACLESQLRDAVARIDNLERQCMADHEQSVQMLEKLLFKGVGSINGSSTTANGQSPQPPSPGSRQPRQQQALKQQQPEPTSSPGFRRARFQEPPPPPPPVVLARRR